MSRFWFKELSITLIYRREIDGLRAVAVIPVILFHAGFSLFSGGFVGVDVFFVISGYLITSILIDDIEQQRFSIVRFYERRARRILPVLFFVLLVSLPFAWSWMLAGQLQDFGASLFSVVTFISNLFFLTQVNYFAPNAEMQPLLHTWSLAVEEQYYLLFPPLLYLAYRFGGRAAFAMVLFFTLLSFGLAEWLGRLNPERNFFFTGSRLWEIGVGSVAAFIVSKQGVGNNQWLALVGFSAVVVAVFTYDKSLPFPGVYTLLPVLGVFLLILYAGSETFVAKALSGRLIVGIGLISYSAYLWHQPVFAFVHIRTVDDPSWSTMLSLVALSLVLAAFSWRFVEQPFRGKQPLLASRKALFLASFVGLSAFGGIGVIVYKSEGALSRLPDRVSQLESSTKIGGGECRPADYGCLIGAPNNVAKTVLFGDSHAAGYAAGFAPILTDKRVSMKVFTGGCAPVFDYRKYLSTQVDIDCGKQMDANFLRVSEDASIETIILAAEWGYYVQGWRHESRLFTYRYANSDNTDPNNNPKEFAKSFDATIEMLITAGKHVVLIEPLPEYAMRIPESMAKIYWRDGDMEQLLLPLEVYETRNAELFALLGSTANKGVERVGVSQFFCDDALCWPFSDDNVPLLSDGNHLNKHGLAIVSNPLLKSIGVID